MYNNISDSLHNQPMKKVGIMSLYYHNYNFGGLLQAYALQNVIERKGYCCEQICYRRSNATIKEKLINSFKSRPFLETIYMISSEVIKLIFKVLLGNIMSRVCAERIKRFKEFEKSIPHSEIIVDKDSICKYHNGYTTIITGSDQVWGRSVDIQNYCLSFADEKINKVAYAASTGGINFSDLQKKTFEKFLPKFSAISVRESSLAEKINQIINKQCDVVCDPVFLISKDEWSKILPKTHKKSPYIFCYLLGSNMRHRRYAKKLAKRLNMSLYVFPYITTNNFYFADFNFGNIRDYVSGPLEFVSLLKDAEMVITDSFHATAFSLIFEKKFFVFPRIKKTDTFAGNNRLYDLLCELNMECNIVNNYDELLDVINNQINYSGIRKQLDSKITRSHSWLNNVLARN